MPHPGMVDMARLTTRARKKAAEERKDNSSEARAGRRYGKKAADDGPGLRAKGRAARGYR